MPLGRGPSFAGALALDTRKRRMAVFAEHLEELLEDRGIDGTAELAARLQDAGYLSANKCSRKLIG
jgi:hypothetical protein